MTETEWENKVMAAASKVKLEPGVVSDPKRAFAAGAEWARDFVLTEAIKKLRNFIKRED